MQLKLVSILSENVDFFIRELAGYLSCRTGFEISAVEDVPWQERERMLDRGEAHIGFFCGLYYVQNTESPDHSLELLAAPVMCDPRCGDRPVYFSEVVVRRDSPYRSFAELRGKSWSYNEPRSHSGYNLVRSHLAGLGETRGYFGRVVEAGSHLRSLELILEREICASAIDSTVLDMERQTRPELTANLRTIEILGPSTIPPAVARREVPHPVRARLGEALLEMHRDEEGRRLLGSALIRRFAAVRDEDYDDIRQMARAAATVCLGDQVSG